MFYGTASGFRIYHIARGRAVAIADWDDDTEVEAALLVSSEKLDADYRASFPGWKTGQRAQVREWPRVSAVDRDGYSIASDVVPTEVENATYELALRQLTSPGSLSVDWTPPRYKRVSIDGAVSVEYAYFGSARDLQLVVGVIGDILAPILTGRGAWAGLSGPISRV